MAQTLGLIRLHWNGTSYPVKKGVKFRQSGVKNNVQNANGQALRSSEWQAGEVEATLIPPAGTKLGEFDPTLGERELQLQADTGDVFVIPDAFVEQNPQFSDEGTISVKWFFNTMQQIKG